MKRAVLILALISLFIIQKNQAQESKHTRARDLGIVFEGITGKNNNITDIPGVEVGYATLIQGKGKLNVGKGPVRTGVTAVLPKGKTEKSYPMGYFIFNGDGETTGLPYIHDYGESKGPIGITNTYSVGTVRDAIGDWSYQHFRTEGHHNFSFGLPVVGETYDGGLNDINGLHVKKNDVFNAINSAKSGYIQEGNVGGGTGMVCYWFKGGTGSSSRMLTIGEKEYTVGVLVQANFGFRPDLMMRGAPVGKMLKDTLMPDVKQDGSIIVIVGTDAPLSPSQLNLVAKRVTLGIARTGTVGSSGSGDIFLAFSTQDYAHNAQTKTRQITALEKRQLNHIFRATVDATEEAILNALVAAETMTGINGSTFFELPHQEVKEIVKDYNGLYNNHSL